MAEGSFADGGKMKTIFALLLWSGSGLFGQQRATTVPHQATLNFQNTSCTSNNPCDLQVWRAVCSMPMACPAYVAGSTLWTRVSYGLASATPTVHGTQWVVTDKDPVLQDATTYVYVGTNSYHSSPNTFSDSGPAWSGTTKAGTTAGTPTVPSNGTGNSVH
jgi:hypothetical protein